jgi:hypothetical protein
MTIEAQVATESTATLSPEDNAIAFVESVAKGEPTEQTPEADATSEAAKTPEVVDPKAEITSERQKLLELSAKTNQQHQALTRRTAKLEERERDTAAREAELEKLSTPEEIVSYLVRKRGISENEAWDNIVQRIQNNGKRTPESETAERLARLERERESEKSEVKRQQEAREAAEAKKRERELKSQWSESAAELAKETPDKWPTLAAQQPILVSSAALRVLEQYYEETGIVATKDQVLDYLEKQAAPPAPAPKVATAPTAEKRRAEPIKTPNNLDASSAEAPRVLTEQERVEAATRWLESQMQ